VSEVVIEVDEDGPYHVIGRIPISRVSKVLSDKREAIGWNVDDELAEEDEMWLCRCGNSTNKPYCSDAHLDVPFDGTETAATNSYEERAEVLGGTEVQIVDDRSVCTHASFCSSKITNAWKAAELIDDDEELRDTIVKMVSRCPSGALTIYRNGVPVEPNLPLEIRVQQDGPLLITGGVTVKRADGQTFEMRNRIALCRCGQSSNKPLCDGTHKEIGFTDG
jgi:CDGSH-type Zn-finger protein